MGTVPNRRRLEGDDTVGSLGRAEGSAGGGRRVGPGGDRGRPRTGGHRGDKGDKNEYYYISFHCNCFIYNSYVKTGPQGPVSAAKRK